MQVKVESLVIQVSSAQPQELRKFYKDVVELEVDEQVGGFKLGTGHMTIDAHSEITGPTKEPARVLINFFVSDIDAEQSRLAGKGVTFIRDQGREFWGAVISTFADPDGNYCQLIEFRPEEATDEG